MRSRSSRLFIVLLHLFGVSTNLPANPFLAALFPNGPGIVGVHPLTIVLEPLELRSAGGLDELLNMLERAGYNIEDTVLNEPYWLQDDTDAKCLGPAGFSECGETTLWTIRRRPVARSKKNNGAAGNGPLSFLSSKKHDKSEDEKEWEYAFELFDRNIISSSEPNTDGDQNSCQVETRKKRKSGYSDAHCSAELMGECMISVPSSDISSGSVVVGECSSNQAWSWRISEDGALLWDSVKGGQNEQGNVKRFGRERLMWLGGPNLQVMKSTQSEERNNKAATAEEGIFSDCVWRFNSTVATTMACNSSVSEDAGEKVDNGGHVRFSVVQYQAGAPVSPTLPRFSATIVERIISLPASPRDSTKGTLDSSASRATLKEGIEEEDHSHLPRRKRTSQDHASLTLLHPELKTTSALAFGNNMRSPSNSQSEKTKVAYITDVSLKSISPISGGSNLENKSNDLDRSKNKKSKMLLYPLTSTSDGATFQSHDDNPQRPRKIPVHPYIAASKNGMYEDPYSGLTYRTDLSEYLGHNRKLRGRHTLMGVGIYYKTMLNIKVYGIALYVPKRDVLADAGFKKFASMTKEELRNCDDFYNHLMGVGSDPLNGGFDRTIFIKINMQLSVESIRTSLEADWKYLSPTHKKMLTDSTFKLRHAEERMIETIMSKENSSRCSCAQVAPESYNADSTCCARGTELVFTWRKNGNLELRIDGRIMDIFPDPEVGRGIFYEYLRSDDPMSSHAREHFADGFPFLLAPLVQVKGISSPVQKPTVTSQTGERDSFRFGLGERLGSLLNMINHHTSQTSEWIHGNIQGGISNMASGTRVLTTATQNLGSEIERRRNLMWGHIMDLPEQSFKFVTSRLSFGKRDQFNALALFRGKRDVLDLRGSPLERKRTMQRKVSNEKGVIVEPSMNFTHMLFLYLVHFYLILLLIVSIPDSYTIRLVVKRPGISPIDSESSCEKGNLRKGVIMGSFDLNGNVSLKDEEFHSTQNSIENGGGKKMKKSLSYYL